MSSLRFFRSDKLRTKLVVPFTIVLSLSITLISLTFIYTERSILSENLDQKAESLARNLAAIIQEHLAMGEYSQTRKILEAANRTDSDVVSGFVAGADRLRIASTEPELADQLIPADKFDAAFKDVKDFTLRRQPEKERFEVIMPLRYGSSQSPLGFLRLVVSTKSMTRQIRFGAVVALITAFVAILMGVGAYSKIAQLVITPLRSAIERLQEMSTGAADLSTRLPVLSSDEAGQLSRSFNGFLEAEERRYRLKQHLAHYLSDLGRSKSFSAIRAHLQSTLSEYTDPKSIVLYVKSPDGVYRPVMNEGEEQRPVMPIDDKNPVLRWLQGAVEVWAWSDVEQHFRTSLPLDTPALKRFKESHGEPWLLVPLTGGGELLGWFTMGELAHGLSRTMLVSELINQLRDGLAIAISNILLFDEVRQFAITMETRVKERTAELATANARLQDLDRAKSEFLSVVSHEIRTPMTSISGFATTLRRQSDKLGPEKRLSYLDIIITESGRLTRLVEDLLDVTKIELGKFDLRRERTKVAPVVLKIAEALRIQNSRLSFPLEMGDPELELDVDVDKLEQVLINLSGNAIKYSPDNGSVTLRIDKKAGEAVFSVIDQGPGIPKEHIGKLFQKFFRVETADPNAVKSGPRGTGLGLMISKRIVELHGGKIWVDSQPGRGTCFSFTIPLSANSQQPS